MKTLSEKQEPTPLNNSKKTWALPELALISKGYLESGANPGAHEANFTPNHSHYISSKSGHSFVVPASFFGKYIS